MRKLLGALLVLLVVSFVGPSVAMAGDGSNPDGKKWHRHNHKHHHHHHHKHVKPSTS